MNIPGGRCAPSLPHCRHHWRPTAIDADPLTGRVYGVRYACSLCPAWQERAGDGLTRRAVRESDPGPLDAYLPVGFTVDDYAPYGAVDALGAACERQVA